MINGYADPMDRKASRIRLAALSLALSGIFFVLYPAIRPFSDESSLQGAAAFASSAWVLAHSLAMLAFILLLVELSGLYLRLKEKAVERLAIPALLIVGIGVGLTLPYYGAEAFSLHAIGQEALKQNNLALLSLANSIRFGVGILFFGLGLLLLAAGVILLAIAIWRSGSLPKWSGIPLAVAFSLFIPQFLAPQSIRVIHGLLITIGCMWIAWSMLRQQQPQPLAHQATQK